MKLAVLLLIGVIAVTANAKYYKHHSDDKLSQIATFKDEVKMPGFFDSLRERMEQKVKELAQNYIKFLERKLNDLVNKFVAKLSSLAQYSLYNVDKMARDARTEFLLSDDNNSVPCFNEHRQEFENAQSFARQGVENCTLEATLELNVVKKNVSQHIKAIEMEVENINGILKECIDIFNPFSTTKCIFKNVSNLMTSMKDIVASAIDAIKSGGENLSKVGKDTKVCIESNVKVAEVNTTIVIDDIKKCIEVAHNATTEVPPTERPTTEAPTTENPETETTPTPKPTTEKQPETETTPTPKPTTEKQPETETTSTPKPTSEKPETEVTPTPKPITQ